MDINAVNNNTAFSTQNAGGSNQTTLGKDDFLTLMVAQLENQDPLNPADPTELLAQTAQFSTLEQMINVNTNLEALMLYQGTLNNSMAVTSIGQEVTAQGNTIFQQNGQESSFTFSLEGDAAETYINIFDQNGNFVSALEPGPLAAGEHTLTWDGLDTTGNPLGEGVFTYTVDAVSAEGELVLAEAQIQGVVESVQFLNGSPYLMVGGQLVPLTAVTDIQAPSGEGETE